MMFSEDDFEIDNIELPQVKMKKNPTQRKKDKKMQELIYSKQG